MITMGFWFFFSFLLLFPYVRSDSHVTKDHDERAFKERSAPAGRSYKLEEKIAVECLNRTIDSGEHVGLHSPRNIKRGLTQGLP